MRLETPCTPAVAVAPVPVPVPTGPVILALVDALADCKPDADFAALAYCLAVEKRVTRVLVTGPADSIAARAAAAALQDLGAGTPPRQVAEGCLVNVQGVLLTATAMAAMSGSPFDLVVLDGDPILQLTHAAYLLEHGTVSALGLVVLRFSAPGGGQYDAVLSRLTRTARAVRITFACGATVLALTGAVAPDLLHSSPINQEGPTQ